MKKFEYMEKYDYEQLVFCYDKTSGLKAIICIHDTTLGPALGGTRMWVYENEDDAILDALRLARGMTYKAAAAGLNLGGGKTVIMGDPKKDKSEELWRAFGRYVQSLNGRYITAEDVGTSVEDMDYVAMETDYVTGLSGTSGDPSPMTAFGVYKGMKACCKEVYGSDSLEGKVVAVQGLGHVGYYLCKHIHEEGGKLIVTDIDQERIDKVVKEFGATAVAPDEIYGVECDIFAPCALGAVVNDETIPQFKCRIIAGAANNVLKEERHGDIIHEKGILYAPDYVINAGGLINVYHELLGYNRDNVLRDVAKIYDRILKVIEISKRDNIPTYKAADIMAEERIEKMGRVRSNYIVR
ncbi:leucine dehydrogenase [Anoxybacter fermentans]|uniref:Leucine dehydrogenase n=1 Tax=Anoxybacter fermentans TaxID=1323375 RepID=A0A3Q9HQJ6_9FIRM|nr:Glu/Leu/Phe/Val dehydrogenase [Anoxybacter fermentans]AZR73445.1 leucine dehydrogenase [Anoxybacter fermentans]